VLCFPAVSVALRLPQTAHAFSFYQFQSPSGNVFCGVGTLDNGKAFAECDIIDRSWSPPEPPRACDGEWGSRIGPAEGRPAAFECHGDTLFGTDLPTLGYGNSYSEGLITCSDTSTGHFFMIRGVSNQLGRMRRNAGGRFAHQGS
jgi:hypothetical protein